MNPIDQLMQSFATSPSPAIAGLIGTGQSSGTAQGDSSVSAAQFAEALQAIEMGTMAPAQDLTADQAEMLASLQMTLAPNAMSAQMQTNQLMALTPAGSGGDAASNPNSALLAKNGVSGLAIQAALANSEGNPAIPVWSASGGQQAGQDIPMLPQAALEKLGLKLEQLPALPSSEELAAVAQAGTSSNSHILPADAAQGLFGAAVENAPVLAQTADGSAVQVTPDAVGPAVNGATGQAAVPTVEQALAAGSGQPSALIAGSPDTPVSAPAPIQPPTPQAVSDAPAQPNQAQPTPAAAGAQAQSNDAEGNGVMTQQAQQQVAAAAPKATVADRNLQTGHKAGNAGKEAFDLKLGAATSSATVKDAATAKPVEPVQSLPDTQAPLPARESHAPLTPERLSGFLDGTSANAVAAGLTGLKGETGFMASMSLLGGKPTPELAHQVSQQLNMHVTKAFKDGQQEFTMRLDPAELGRVRVKLSFLEGGRVHAQVMAERPETLELMQRDTRGLEKAIEAAGHKTDGSIQFSLDTNDQESAGRAFAEAVQQEKMRDELAARSGMGHQNASTAEDDLLEEEVPLETILANVSVETGLDIKV
ncbi:flagellar hook-length control protein FliK [Kordiimonas lacus]|nr:flagellar hook-length control protein FliK [Kordiimonas lacus]